MTVVLLLLVGSLVWLAYEIVHVAAGGDDEWSVGQSTVDRLKDDR